MKRLAAFIFIAFLILLGGCKKFPIKDDSAGDNERRVRVSGDLIVEGGSRRTGF